MTKKVRHVRYLSVGAYSKDGDGILIITSPKGTSVRLPRKRVTNKSILRFDDCFYGFNNEVWLASLTDSIMRQQTGITEFIKNGESRSIMTGVQRMPATYSVTNCRETSSSIIIEEESAIILGRVDYSSLKNPFAFFIKLSCFKELVKNGKINLAQQFLILRILASRDDPDRIEAERAGRLLDELQRKHP